MLRWMFDHMRLDRIRNDVVRDNIGLIFIEDKMGETRVKWFSHIRRRSKGVSVRRCEKIDLLVYRRGQGGPRKRWGEVIRNDLKTSGLTKDMAQDRKLWRSMINVADFRLRVYLPFP